MSQDPILEVNNTDILEVTLSENLRSKLLQGPTNDHKKLILDLPPIKFLGDKIPPPSQPHCRWPDCMGSEGRVLQNFSREEFISHIKKHVNDYINKARARDSQGKELSCPWGLANSGNECMPIKTEQMLEHMLDHVSKQQQGEDVAPIFHNAISLPNNIIKIWGCAKRPPARQKADSGKVQHFCPGCKVPFTYKGSLENHIFKNRSFECNRCNVPVKNTDTIHMC